VGSQDSTRGCQTNNSRTDNDQVGSLHHVTAVLKPVTAW
jgi:hypothetical protein